MKDYGCHGHSEKMGARATPKQNRQQHTVEFSVPFTAERTEGVPSHKMVHTFTRHPRPDKGCNAHKVQC